MLDPQQRRAFRDRANDIEGIDSACYECFGADPLEPVIGLGAADTRIGFFGRDPGREEVRYGEPFIGAGGQKVRKTLYEHLYGRPMPNFEASRALGSLFFWANTVPYKPQGNKAWPMKVKKRFHPLMSSLLVSQWRGEALITLGREAFLWFGIDQPREARQRLEAFWRRDDRFENSTDITLSAADGQQRRLDIYPLPHPSPLNATWYKRFPGLLKARLRQLDVRADNLRMDRR